MKNVSFLEPWLFHTVSNKVSKSEYITCISFACPHGNNRNHNNYGRDLSMRGLGSESSLLFPGHFFHSEPILNYLLTS